MTWGISSYSTTPGSNAAINGINIAPGCPSSSVGPALRQLMADIANALAGNAGGAFVPAGAIVWFPTATAPAGYQALDHTAISRTANPNVFAMIGTTYGVGDGSTTFNVPDWRGRCAIGYDASNTSGRMTKSTSQGIDASTVGNVGGEQAHALATGELAAHSHGVSDPSHTHTVSDPGHAHQIRNTMSPSAGGANVNNLVGNNSNADFIVSDLAVTGISLAAVFTGISIQSAGSGTAHNVVQPGIVQLPCIRLG